MNTTIENTPNPSFCIDIDNVITDADTAIRSIIFSMTNGRVSLTRADIVSYNYYDCVDLGGEMISKDEWNIVHEEFSKPSRIISMLPIPGSMKAIESLSKKGTINFATARLPIAHAATIEWLNQLNLSRFKTHFSEHGRKHEQAHNASMIIEDDYKQALNFVNKTGAIAYVFRYPWNESFEYDQKRLFLVENWDHLLGII